MMAKLRSLDVRERVFRGFRLAAVALGGVVVCPVRGTFQLGAATAADQFISDWHVW